MHVVIYSKSHQNFSYSDDTECTNNQILLLCTVISQPYFKFNKFQRRKTTYPHFLRYSARLSSLTLWTYFFASIMLPSTKHASTNASQLTGGAFLLLLKASSCCHWLARAWAQIRKCQYLRERGIFHVKNNRISFT